MTQSLLEKAPQRDRIEILFAAMGDKSRRNIVYRVMEKSQSIKDLAEPLGITLTGAAQHIKILENAHLIKTRKIGRERICEFDPKGFEMLETFAKFYGELWKSRFDNLRNILED